MSNTFNAETTDIFAQIQKINQDRQDDLYATSDSWHYIIGSLASTITRGRPVKIEDLEWALLEAEKFGNESRQRKGLPESTSAVDAIERLRKEIN